MAELLEAVTSWWNLLLALLVFGFAPGFCLRLIVLAYPRGDPRRAELIAELYAVPRIWRPVWVAEQLEVALFEGLAHRISAVLRRLASRERARGWTGPPPTLMAVMSVLALASVAWEALRPGGFPDRPVVVITLLLAISGIALSLLTVMAVFRRGSAREAARRTDSKE